jgi:hypothetical protein
MQTAPFVTVKTIAAAGYASNLMDCLTHLDLVAGDNLPTDQAKMNQVLYALTNLLNNVGQDIDHPAEEALEQILEGRVFFAGRLNRTISSEHDGFTRMHLNNLLDAIESIPVPDQKVGFRFVRCQDRNAPLHFLLNKSLNGGISPRS